MSQDLHALRAHLFAALEGVKAGSLALDQARAVNELAKTLVDTGKLEVQYLKTTGGGESKFIEPGQAEPEKLPPGIVRVTRHRLAG
jgi:hypothetical protein